MLRTRRDSFGCQPQEIIDDVKHYARLHDVCGVPTIPKLHQLMHLAARCAITSYKLWYCMSVASCKHSGMNYDLPCAGVTSQATRATFRASPTKT